MSLTLTDSPLAANLAALGKRNRDVADRIRACSPAADVEFAESGQGVLTATRAGRPLASRQRPLDEARRLADTVDVIGHGAVVVLGFGLGYHVEAIAARMRRTGVIVVFEPDLPLLRAVLDRVDHSRWLAQALVLICDGPEDAAALGRKLHGAEAILGQGVALLEHPASRIRLGAAAGVFSRTMTDFVTATKLTLLTTLIRSVDTVHNLMRNARHYIAGPTVAPLKDAAPGALAVVVSAGPSLRRNLDLLTAPGVRDRAVIIAVQTTLKPLLEAGIRPHFVTALDYHEISRRFYEGLTADDVAGTTLVVDPKAHPCILETFPGPVRCFAAAAMDRVLGDLRRDVGALPLGATVAHLAVYLARWLGCNPIAMIGQDLGFPDGLYYTPGTAIHDVWAPELNPFNTIAMMEWQRIVRMRAHLHKTFDAAGKPIYTDAQMLTYWQQFERDFSQFREEGIEIIDATEGGVVKQHATALPLRDVLARHATRPLPALPRPEPAPDPARLAAGDRRLGVVRDEVRELRTLARRTAAVIRRMQGDQGDAAKMAKHFEKVEAARREVEARMDTFHLLDAMNQVGAFKRLRADRRLELSVDLDPAERQRAQLDRDLENVEWLADAATVMLDQLDEARRAVRGEPAPRRPRRRPVVTQEDGAPRATRTAVAALVPVDPRCNGLGLPRSLDARFGDDTVLHATLARLGAVESLAAIVLIAPEGLDVAALYDPARIGRPVVVERCAGDGPCGPEHAAVAAARLFTDTCWRGGVAGLTACDEVLCPHVMAPIMERRGLGAALLVGPDWPLVDVSEETGCPALVERFRELDDARRLVFSQGPPGIGACVVGIDLMRGLVDRTRLGTIGAALGYIPQLPQEDPIGKNGNVQIDHAVRHSLVRATFDSPRQRALLAGVSAGAGAADAVAAIEAAARESTNAPRHLIVELTTERAGEGVFARTPHGAIRRDPLDTALAERIFGQFAEASDDGVITFAGVGDPLLHPAFDTLLRSARAAGVRGVHVRTELAGDTASVDRLLAAEPDIVSVDLHADTQATYTVMMGERSLATVIGNIEHLSRHRRTLAGPPDPRGFALPWIVPRLQRRAETYEDIETFFDRWQHIFGTAVIEPPPPFPRTADWPGDTLAEAVTPARVVADRLEGRMTIYADGAVPRCELDLPGRDPIGNVAHRSLAELWGELLAWRRAHRDELRMLRP